MEINYQKLVFGKLKSVDKFTNYIYIVETML